MKTPSVKNLVSTFRLSPTQAGLIKRIGRATDNACELAELILSEVPSVAPSGHDIRYSNHMWLVTYALRAIDSILGTYGVESLGADNDSVMGPPAYEYLNTGDTYAATLIYYRDADTIRIGNWGDVAERMGY